MKFLDFEAVVEVDGVALQEYGIQCDETAKHATCWIPSEAGKTFAITYQPLRAHVFPILSRMYVDGIDVGANFCPPSSRQRHTRKRIRTSANTARQLLFSTVQLTDEESLVATSTHMQLGDIVVKLYQTEAGPAEVGTYRGLKRELPICDKIHEKTKKAVSHRVDFGEERPYTHRLHTRQIKRIKTLATFTFKYRSIDILKADGIAPSDPVPQGNRGKRKASEIPEIEEDLDSRTDEEDSAMYKGLVEALQALEEKRAKRKARKAVPGASKKIKKEHTTHTRPLPNAIEVIDLT